MHPTRNSIYWNALSCQTQHGQSGEEIDGASNHAVNLFYHILCNSIFELCIRYNTHILSEDVLLKTYKIKKFLKPGCSMMLVLERRNSKQLRACVFVFACVVCMLQYWSWIETYLICKLSQRYPMIASFSQQQKRASLHRASTQQGIGLFRDWHHHSQSKVIRMSKVVHPSAGCSLLFLFAKRFIRVPSMRLQPWNFVGNVRKMS